jgi:hypothetical protein
MDANTLFGQALGLGSGWKVIKSEMAFSQGLVIGISFAAHAWSDAPGTQAMLKGIGGLLADAMTVMDKTNQRSLRKYPRSANVGTCCRLHRHGTPDCGCARARRGVWIGSLFVASKEAFANRKYKERLGTRQARKLASFLCLRSQYAAL